MHSVSAAVHKMYLSMPDILPCPNEFSTAHGRTASGRVSLPSSVLRCAACNPGCKPRECLRANGGSGGGTKLKGGKMMRKKLRSKPPHCDQALVTKCVLLLRFCGF